jgi:hypothetical protein
MRRRSMALAPHALVVLVGLLVASACNDPPTPAVCTDVPDGGCPQDNGPTVCQDPTCDAVYDCVDGKWVFDKACPAHPHDASAPTDAADEAVPPDVHIDAPPGAYGGPGCTDLETPDCSLGTALACVGATDCCGCQDVWICQNMGWTPWGQCADGGLVEKGAKD